jgi:glycosyltransferase involved in cell wall biosynthesis
MDKKHKIIMKKNVLVVSFTPFFGGGESFVVNILSKIPDPLFYMLANEDLYTMIKVDNKYLIKAGNFLRKVYLVKKIIQDDHIDIVILNGGSALFVAPFIGRIQKIGIRHTLNSYIPLRKKLYYIILLHIAYYALDIIIHVSNKSKKEQLLFNKKSITIYNGVKIKYPNEDYGSLQIDQNHVWQFLFVGRVSKDKGVDIIINAFESLGNKNIHLHIVGSGELCTNKKYKTVTFYGFQTDLEEYYLHADYFISLPSMENCPFSTLDALSYGVPVITTRVGGLEEIIIDGYNGFFVKRNVKTIKKFINKLIVDNDKHETLRENAKKTIVDKFNIDDTVKKYQQVIKTVCE